MRDTIDDVESAIGDRDRDALRQSVLKAAFEGRLVPQDPADEPAVKLLTACAMVIPAMG
jgi:type I restriction enzyme, S subunit